MEDFEKLGAFYLGKVYDLQAKKTKDELLLYDSKDLTTHAVCVGMTGSGKTGLCISLIEEAAIDGVPSILIDPKGDLGNLLLTFPDLKGGDFLPWINQDDARQKNLSPEEFADKQAALWRQGLADWGQSGERIKRLREAVDMLIYTPGSQAGLPVSILNSFAAPGKEILEDSELLRDRIGTTVASLLGLVGIDADPIQSKEHILLSTILESAWRGGKDLDLAGLIQQVQSPLVAKIGVLDLESFFPSKERFELVMALNNLLASPGFSDWLEGTPLDIGQILYTPSGKPRIAIFSIAHLSDAERMFFVSLLMNQVVGWMRTQSGTNSLRAIVYMDEIFGFLPPVSNPPSKQAMLTLLKQARAFGVGMVFATQNPVDLDYKALSNAGTWFIGRLQTEQDKARLLDGLDSASTAAAFDRKQVEKIISDLDSRVFLLNNTHEDAPELFQTRWALSYLRGPLTRDQIKTLMKGVKTLGNQKDGTSSASAETIQPAAIAANRGQPALPPEIQQFFIPVSGTVPKDKSLVYHPKVIGVARIHFSDSKKDLDYTNQLVFTTDITDNAIPVAWEQASLIPLQATDLEKQGQASASFGALPSSATQEKQYAKWAKDFNAWLYSSQRLELFSHPGLKAVSQPGEDERDFRIRLGQVAREQRDAQVEDLRKKYAPKIKALKTRLRKAEMALDKQKDQAKQAGLQTVLSVGTTLLGAFTGRKVLSRTNINKAGTTIRRAGRASEEAKDVDRAQDNVEALQAQLEQLEAEFQGEIAARQDQMDPLTETLETVSLKPKKTDIQVQLVSLAWEPYWQDKLGNLQPA